MKILAFSDIHHALGYPGGIVTSDIVDVERRFNALALERQVDVCIFAGDRFLSHTPEDPVRVAADLVQRERNDLGLVTFSLVGNHDWWGKSHVRGHSNRMAQDVWADRLPNLVIMDQPKTYRHPKVPGLVVHALPAEFDPDLTLYEFDPQALNILVFHACIKGALLDDETEYRSPQGVPLSQIDDPRFHLVLGGDLHIPQRLPFKNTVGGYIGSCIQQTRRDRGELRAFLEVTFDGPHLIDPFEFIDSGCPRFFDIHHKVVDGAIDDEWVESTLVANGENPARVILTVFLHGTRDELDQFVVPPIQCVRHLMSIRKVPSGTTYKTTQHAAVITASPLQVFEQYLAEKDLAGMNPESLILKAAKVLS
jgi:DNA repair exonuclease SbcCD nuclease subunit